MVLAHLVMQSSGGGDVAPSQLNQISCTDTGAIIAEKEIIFTVPYQRTFFQFQIYDALHFRVIKFFLDGLYTLYLNTRNGSFEASIIPTSIAR